MKHIFNGTARKKKQEIAAAGMTYGVSLGRRAPMHRMHVDCILEIVSAGLKPVIVIGSVNGPESPLYDPVRNPLSLEQQKEQIRRALPGLNIDDGAILTLPDDPDDDVWMKTFVGKLKAAGVYGSSVVHFRSKSVDAASHEAVKPLGQYVEPFMREGLAVWQSYNSDPADDTISGTDIRTYDLAHLTDEQRNIIAAPDYIADIARAARADNPDAKLLEKYHVPLTTLDLTLQRLRLEAGISTAEIIRTAREHGDVTVHTLAEAAYEHINRLHAHPQPAPRAKKTLLVLGDSVSPETADYLRKNAYFDTAGASIGKFQSGEPFTEIFYGDEAHFAANAEKIKGAKVVVVQSTGEPVGDHVAHLLEMIHTLKAYGAAEVTAVVPFAAFSRQDRAFEGRFTSIAADLFARELKAAGADKVMSFTMHSEAAIAFYKKVFGENFSSLSATDIFAAYLKGKFPLTSSQIVAGAPDGAEKAGDQGQKRAHELADALNDNFNKAVFEISKTHVAASETKITSFKGDVAGKDCVIIDDMVDGGSTMLNAAKMLKAHGAKSVTCCFTHPVLTAGSGSALEKLMTAKEGAAFAIDNLVMTDSIPEAAAKVAAFAQQYPQLASKIDIIPLGPAILAAVKGQTPMPDVQPAPQRKCA